MGETSNLLIPYKEYIRSGVKITKYKIHPDVNIEIRAIDPVTGNIEWKEVIEFSKHENLLMYKVKDKMNRFKSFWASSDHSLIAYDIKSDSIIRISPLHLISSYGYLLIQYDENNTQYTPKIIDNMLKDKPLLNKLVNNGCSIIPSNEIEVVFDPYVKVGYDMTVKNFYTFSTSDGIFVQDTVAVYPVFSVEAVKDVEDKMYLETSKSAWYGIKTMLDQSQTIELDAALAVYHATK